MNDPLNLIYFDKTYSIPFMETCLLTGSADMNFEGSNLGSRLLVWRLHVLPVLEWSFSDCVSLSKNIYGRLRTVLRCECEWLSVMFVPCEWVHPANRPKVSGLQLRRDFIKDGIEKS